MSLTAGTRVIIENTASRIRVHGSNVPALRKFRIEYKGDVYIHGREEEIPDLMYKPWIAASGNGLVVVGVGPFYRPIFVNSNNNASGHEHLYPPVWLDGNGDIWAKYENQIVRFEQEEWLDCQPTPYYAANWTTIGDEFIINGTKLLTFQFGHCNILDFTAVYPVMYDINSGEKVWEGSPDDMIPLNNFYYCWDAASATILVGGWDTDVRVEGETIGWEAVVAYSDSGGINTSYYESDIWNLDRPKLRRYVTLGQKKSKGRCFWLYYYDGEALRAELRDKNLSLYEDRDVWYKVPVVNTNLDFIIDNKIFKANEDYCKGYILSLPMCLSLWKDIYPLGDTGTCWISNGILVDLKAGRCVEISNASPYGIDSGLSWYCTHGGSTPNFESIYNYVAYPDEIEEMLRI